MLERRFQGLWQDLQGKKPHMPQFLTGVRLQGVRGITDLRVPFEYPVSVIAGGNASGKSTVLFAAACAYKVPGAGVRDYIPSTLFPDYRPTAGLRRDNRALVTLEFYYMEAQQQYYMQWQRDKSWNKSFGGRKGGRQPGRRLYLRTLSNLTNPSEVRGVLAMSRLSSEPEQTPLTASQIEFAQQMLPFRYSEVVDLSSGKKQLLFASQEQGVQYSELHMASGERAILRMSKEIAQLEGALILIDEVEAGLHPWVQQLLMLQLQQLALRNNLQVVVTTHSPVILDSVPPNGRIFLERGVDGQITVRPPYRDIIQDALYGRAGDSLNILCEDDAAEGVLQGVLDYLRPKLALRGDAVRVGRDTGADEFPIHAAAFRKFGQIRHFAFVLDGDKRDDPAGERIKAAGGEQVPVFFLPGREAPESWVWKVMRRRVADAASAFGLDTEDFRTRMSHAESAYDSASDSPSNISKAKIRTFADGTGRSVAEVCRAVAALEAQSSDSDLRPLVEGLETTLLSWRND